MSNNVTVEFEWNDACFHSILNSMELQALCHKEATEIARRAGVGFHAKPWHSNMKGGRTAALVVPDVKGMAREANGKVLTKAVYGGNPSDS